MSDDDFQHLVEGLHMPEISAEEWHALWLQGTRESAQRLRELGMLPYFDLGGDEPDSRP